MRPTRARLLLSIALVSGVLGWGLLRAWETSRGTLPTIAWTTPAALGLLALAVLVTALVLRPRLRRRPGTKPVPPLFAARLAALALASSRVGAAVVGVYAGFALVLAGELDTAFGRRRLWPALLTAAAAGVLVVAGLVLENACRIRDDESRGEPGATGAGGDADPGLGSPA